MRNLALIIIFFFISTTVFSANSTYIKGPNLVKSIATTITSGGTLSLTSTSSMVQTFSGTNNHIVILPNTASIPAGSSFEIKNDSTGIISVKNFSGALLRNISMGDAIVFNLTDSLNWSYEDLSGLVFGGATITPTFVDNGGGNVTINSTTVNLWDNPDFSKSAKPYQLAAITATLADNTTSYAVGDYNSGTPIIKIITDVNLINESSVVPLFTIFRSGSFLHTLDWDTLGRGLANKTHQSIVKTQRYRRESGLAISESGTRNINLTSGIVWVGANKSVISAVASLTDNMFYFLRTGASTWTTQIVTQYNNTDYFTGATTASLSVGRYGVNWLFRGVESQKHLYMVLGEGNYTLTQAQASQPPALLPPNITSHAVLVGRIIVQRGSNTAAQIDSAFNIVFTQQAASNHNDLGGLQGGQAGEYYHLTQGKFNAVENLTASGTQTNFTGDVQSASCVYYGDSVTNGSHRSCQVGGALIYQKRVSGSWLETYRVE